VALLAVSTLTTGQVPLVPSAFDTPGKTRQSAASQSGSNTHRRQLWRFPITGMALLIYLTYCERFVVSVQLQEDIHLVKPFRSKDFHRTFRYKMIFLRENCRISRRFWPAPKKVSFVGVEVTRLRILQLK
jgi:hypothetical protein